MGLVPGSGPTKPPSEPPAQCPPKKLVCEELRRANWDPSGAFANTNKQRNEGNWNDPALRPAENFLYAASYPDISIAHVAGHQIAKVVGWPAGKSTPPSWCAFQAGLWGVEWQTRTPQEWKEWCACE